MAKLATEASINKYLDEFKLSVDSSTDIEAQSGAERIIKGRLFGIVDAATMATWGFDLATPVPPPALIQEIASLLVASIFYSKKYSEDDTQTTPYGQQLYNRGISLLEDVANGTSKLYDLDPSISQFTDNDLFESDFWPNDTTAQQCAQDDKKFRMRMQF